MAITEQRALPRRVSSPLTTRQMSGATLQKMHGGERVGSIYRHRDSLFREVTEEEIDFVKRHWTLFWEDEYMCAFVHEGDIYVTGPFEDEECQGEPATAPTESCCDQAVREAGFATEPHRDLIERLMNALYNRMIGTPFTLKEHELVMEAKAFLIGAEHG